MGWLVIFIIIGILVGIESYIEDMRDYSFKSSASRCIDPKPRLSSNIGIFVVPCIAVGFICWWLLGGILTSTVFKTEEYISYETTIAAFKDSQNTTYVSRRSVEENLRYYYYANTSKGKKTCWISAERHNVYIQEGDFTPKVECYSKRVVGFARYFAINWVLEEDYVFYVPEGTCTDAFNADME